MTSNIMVKGFSLLEVMFTAMLIMFASSALLRLQLHLLQTEQNIIAVRVASELAADKLLDLNNTESFENIATDNGGNLPSGELDLASLNNQIVATSLRRHWEVVDLYLEDINKDGIKETWLAAGDSALSSDPDDPPGKKKVTINISWQTINDTQHTYAMTFDIASQPDYLTWDQEAWQRSFPVP